MDLACWWEMAQSLQASQTLLSPGSFLIVTSHRPALHRQLPSKDQLDLAPAILSSLARISVADRGIFFKLQALAQLAAHRGYRVSRS